MTKHSNLYICLSVCLSVYLSVYLYISIYLSISLLIYLLTILSIYCERVYYFGQMTNTAVYVNS